MMNIRILFSLLFRIHDNAMSTLQMFKALYEL